MSAIYPITRFSGGTATSGDDALAIEEPLELRAGDRALSVTMRTPGDDFALAAGFFVTEGIVRTGDDIESIRHWGSPNVVRVALREGVHVDWQRLQRNFYAGSSCGVCGKASIDAVRIATEPMTSQVAVPIALIESLPERLREKQTSFDATGGVHAAGIFDRDGNCLVVREDVGRHNAVDKAIGERVLAKEPLADSILVVSGRAGFEIVQKAVVAAIPIIVAVGAPSSLAAELARDMNVTLAGFVRENRCNVYAAAQRIIG